jgi:hypothetical protein
MMIKEPKGTPYAMQARSARRALEALRERLAEEETIVWILSITKRFSDGIEDLQFGRGAIVSLVTGSTMREHYQEFVDTVAAQEREKVAATERERLELARQEQAARERKQQEEARVAAAKEAEQQRLAEAERPREQAAAGSAELADGAGRSAAGEEGSGERFAGPGRGRPPRGLGPVGPPGPRAGFDPPAGFEPLPAAGPPEGFGQPRGGAGVGGGRPGQPGQFPTGPPAMGPSVTIRISGPANMNVNAFLEKLKAALKTGNYQTSHSGGEATLTLGYGGDLQVAIDAIDFGKVQSTDKEKREIRVVVP